MDEHDSNLRFLTTTRGRILALLRRSPRTVDELAQALDLTDNTVRTHLAGLQRDGLVRQRGLRRSRRRPALVYVLTPQAERLFPKVSDEVLIALLTVLAESLNGEQITGVVQAAAHRLAAQHPVPAAGSLRTRLTAVVALLNDLGGLMELEADRDTFVICGYSCPLGQVARTRPEVCRLMADMVTELVDVPVHEHCARNESLWCRLEVQSALPGRAH